ncbi:MAG: phosphoribosylamine--glycine ligase [Gammaproteobacteria bacterium]|nr:phosphoribosylamine--glycine ligase [Gammaproteobacteria bacterium]NNM19805.1 phosphoribosylamine--glycine ligase [Gammaproteobacteria bacterium]
MKILVIGGGGREHALAWRVAQSPRVTEVLVAPGNAGTASEKKLRNVDIEPDAINSLLTLAQQEQVHLTIVGPEGPLVAGVVDEFTAAGLRCFGPSRGAARLEGSKAFMKDFLEANRIPTASYEVFDELTPALARIRERGAPIVIKADGLAAGKGVIVAQSVAEAEAAARDMLADRRFGEAGRRIVIEDCLVGEEASFIALVGGGKIMPLASSQDHKTRDEQDRGPNTGGMGAYTPAPVVTPAVHQRIMDEVMQPTVRALDESGTPYVGFLYAGLMIDESGAPRVLEFNCRMGDPETQPIMMRLQSDLAELCDGAIDGRLDELEAAWDPRAALGVVLAAGGYPDGYRKGDPISGLEHDIPGTKVFHAGTAVRDDRVVTAGGRVLCVVGLGHDVAAAQELAYRRADTITWEGAFSRRDIGHRAINR